MTAYIDDIRNELLAIADELDLKARKMVTATEAKLVPTKIRDIEKACVQGHSPEAVATAYKVPVAYVVEKKKKYNPRLRKKYYLTVGQKVLLAHQMHNEGVPYNLIAKQIECSFATVRTYLHKRKPEFRKMRKIRLWRDVFHNLTVDQFIADPIYYTDKELAAIDKLAEENGTEKQ
ncbi:Uncharacterised protein [Serratia quinivorans]|uniref:hypothetical protein n=1 Tax=Serratia quinivorans TaxID=137545 RepID=UPI00217C7710|nr:hypothetical protein [Serratia quinivorans]CAI2019349.1 Uncharacterised protein [Serratia quinivorans]